MVRGTLYENGGLFSKTPPYPFIDSTLVKNCAKSICQFLKSILKAEPLSRLHIKFLVNAKEKMIFNIILL
jgi:hypothetical protein